jgi:aminoglycoside phosphotransferase (APT) family kinase protein
MHQVSRPRAVDADGWSVIDVDAALAHQLVAAQFPELANLPIRPVDKQGWDNRTFRLGERMKLRFPRAAAYAAQAEKEARWLPVLAEQLHVEIPRVIAVNPPAGVYPFNWSLQSWIDGKSADAAVQADSSVFASDVARLLNALHAIDASEGPAAGEHNFHRGGDLRTYDVGMRAAAGALGADIDVSSALALWDDALGSRWEAAVVWVHGDIAAGNLLAGGDGRLGGVIDFGCMAASDPACDLTIAWTLFEGEARSNFQQEVNLDAASWARARGWALWKAAMTLAADNANVAARRVIADIVAEPRF